MQQGGQQPVYILKEGTDRTRGRTAQSNNIYAAHLIAETVKTTLLSLIHISEPTRPY